MQAFGRRHDCSEVSHAALWAHSLGREHSYSFLFRVSEVINQLKPCGAITYTLSVNATREHQ